MCVNSEAGRTQYFYTIQLHSALTKESVSENINLVHKMIDILTQLNTQFVSLYLCILKMKLTGTICVTYYFSMHADNVGDKDKIGRFFLNWFKVKWEFRSRLIELTTKGSQKWVKSN